MKLSDTRFSVRALAYVLELGGRDLKRLIHPQVAPLPLR